MSVDSTTRRQPTPPPPPPSGSGLNPLTLAIAAIASVIAAVVVSHFWSGGTLWATAMTPVIVAVVKEALERPAQRITEVSIAPRRRPDELVVEEVEPGPGPYAEPEPAGYRTYGVRRKHFKLAIVTGLIAFVIGAAILTIPELVAGRSITNGNRGFTVLGGKSRTKKRQERKQTETTTVTTTTTVPQDQGTTTTPPEQQTTPTTPQDTTTTPPPAQTAPPPQNTTPAPPAASPPPAQTQPQP